jgi:hypothetical protein
VPRGVPRVVSGVNAAGGPPRVRLGGGVLRWRSRGARAGRPRCLIRAVPLGLGTARAAGLRHCSGSPLVARVAMEPRAIQDSRDTARSACWRIKGEGIRPGPRLRPGIRESRVGGVARPREPARVTAAVPPGRACRRRPVDRAALQAPLWAGLGVVEPQGLGAGWAGSRCVDWWPGPGEKTIPCCKH